MSTIVDAHHHLLDPARIDYPFLRFLPQLAKRLTADDLAPLARAAGVAKTVAVQASDCEDETQFLLDEAARSDLVAGVVGWVPLADPVACARALDRFAKHPGRLVGIRHLIHDEADPDWVVQPQVLESLGMLAARGLAFDLSAFQPRHLEHVATFAERVPELRVVVCHYGMPRVDQQQWEPWASTFARAAENPNAVVKISGLDLFLGGPDPARTRPYFEHAIQCYGPARMIWASNWPVSLQLRGYAELLDAAHVQIAGLDAPAREGILGANAERVYGLEAPR